MKALSAKKYHFRKEIHIVEEYDFPKINAVTHFGGTFPRTTVTSGALGAPKSDYLAKDLLFC